MNDVLILYPHAFTCYSKFERKVLRILSNLQDYTISTTADENNFISTLCSEKLNGIRPNINKDYDIKVATHAVIFDDGEEFHNEYKQLLDTKTPVRLIKIKITRVINIKKDTSYQGLKSTHNYEYIGRGAKWGNPHSMYEEGDDRDEVIRKFKYDFDFDKFPHISKNDVYELAGKRLGCFCKPATCHGDVLADYLNSWDDGS